MQVERQVYSDAVLITVMEPRIDAALAVHFKDHVKQHSENAPSRVVVDMSHVQFLDSSGLGAMVAAMKQLGPDRSLELVSLTPTVEKVFKLTKMDTVFTIHDSAKTAIADLAHAS